MEGASKEEKTVESKDRETFKDEIFSQEEELECTQAKIIEAREENERLKTSLNQILKNYQTLQMQYNDLIAKKASNGEKTNEPSFQIYKEAKEPDHFISLSLGRTSSPKQHFKNEAMVNENKESGKEKQRLSLGLECENEIASEVVTKPSSESSMDLGKEEIGHREDTLKSSEVLQQNSTKRARVSLRVRCDTPTMNDGCQWRKYGQKIAKGNPCPRAYYRCTVAPSCPVRKQVQRCSQDMSILIVTYEGAHNHPLSISATAIASATSSAAAMLLSGSSTSPSIGASSSSNFRGLNFNAFDLSKPKQLYISNNPTSSTNPTITLDLTSSSSSSIFNKFSSNYLSTQNYSSTNLSFNPLESNPLPLSWGGSHSYSKNQVDNSLNFGGQYTTLERNIYKPDLMKSPNPKSHQQTLAPQDVLAATRAITSDPNFQSALVTALTTIISNRENGKETFENSKRILENYQCVSNFPPSSNQNCSEVTSSFPGRNSNPMGTSNQEGNMVFPQPQSPFGSCSKGKSPSPSDEEHS